MRGLGRKFKIKFLIMLSIQLFTLSAMHCQELSLEAIYKYPLFVPDQVVGIRSMNDGIHYTVLENKREVVKYSYASGERVEILFSSDMDSASGLTEISEYQLSDNETAILLTTEREDIYRYSFSSNYYVYTLADSCLTPVFNEGRQQLAAISPDGLHVAFVFENNLYIRDIKSESILQVTSDGVKNKIINGSPDWVYEEEFTLLQGFYWSNDSKKIAFYRFDESNVKEFDIALYDELNLHTESYKYPKAGEENAKVEIYVYNLDSNSKVRMITPNDSDSYVPRIKWLPNSNKLCITSLNRRQNRDDLFISDVSNGHSYSMYSEENEKYISEFSDDFVTFIDSGRQALIMSEKSGFMHVYRYGIDGTFINQVTSGYWEVDDILGVDKFRNRLYYTSTEVSPIERHVYSIGFDGSEKKQLTSRHGVHHADFSKTYNYFILTSSDANTPFEVRLYDNNNHMIRLLENNDFVKEMTREFKFVEKEFFSFVNNEGDTLFGYQILPPGFKKNRKYPVLVYVYGGPEVQMVMDQWENRLAWLQLIAQKGYIVVCIDNRGTDGRGEAFEKSTYLQLGRYETEDQIAFAEYLASKSYVNKNRIGIFGWSYGGYMSLLCLMKGYPVFKAAIAVAPVTNWRFYDSIYTERFMRKPQENAEGYDNNSPLYYVNQMEGKLLLIHGTADDNVHLQNSMVLIKQLVEADKSFEMQFYPDQDHGISDGNATFHLFNRITDFIVTNL
jgi:dipeptidyl-peptidase 4